MDDRGRLYLRLKATNVAGGNDMNGSTPIKINRQIKKQLLTLTSYSVTCTNQNLLGTINVIIANCNNTSHLIDNSPSDVNFQIDLSNSTTQTFVPSCMDHFNMNAPLQEYFTVRITREDGTALPNDSVVSLKFLFNEL